MDKKRLEIIFTIILVIIFIFVGLRAAKAIKKKTTSKVSVATDIAFKKDSAIPLAQPKTASAMPRDTNSKSTADDISWVRCCFSGKFYTTQDGVSNLNLSGILWDEVDPQAVINQEIFKREDKIGNYVIVDIQRNKVILNDGEKNLELKLQEY
ncbi:MAG: hypothetical protein KBB01_03990 [Candidatus Omnitrophica bacterium]|jgi:hypothetical protein|nr:hypothetical protein [Candidatus Omnitrophota bacterium]